MTDSLFAGKSHFCAERQLICVRTCARASGGGGVRDGRANSAHACACASVAPRQTKHRAASLSPLPGGQAEQMCMCADELCMISSEKRSTPHCTPSPSHPYFYCTSSP